MIKIDLSASDLCLLANILQSLPPTTSPEFDKAVIHCQQVLKQKLWQMSRHDCFTLYKSVSDKEAREHFREEYLDITGILPDFRTLEETPCEFF